MNDKPQWNLYEVWGDTVDARQLAISAVIGLVVSISVFFLAARLFKGMVASADLARAYAMLAGLGGCLLSGVICALKFPPKREVLEGKIVDTSWRLEVLKKLAEQNHGLGNIADLPPSVVQEMKELEIYDIFASFDERTGTLATEKKS